MSCCCQGEEHEHVEEDIEEMNHFNEIVNSFRNYLVDTPQCLAPAVTANAEFLSNIVKNAGSIFGHPTHIVAGPTEERNISKVRSTLKQFVREWALAGKSERDTCFVPLIEGLSRWLDPREVPFVLCPGSGLGRLPYEICKAGFNCQGNEFSYHMLLGSHFVLNEISLSESHTIYPYVTCSSSQGISFPDEVPSKTPGQMSMCAGEFVEVYEQQGVGIADGIVTCFFIDTAKNILLYIRTIANAVKAGGVWVNLGPLLYHYAEQEDQISIELSWLELRELIAEYFDFKEERTGVECVYSANPFGETQTVYECIYFAAVRNNRNVEGYSNPVF